MKPKFLHITIVIGLLSSTTWVLSQQTSALANIEPLTRQGSDRLSFDRTPFPNFFREGNKSFEREIQQLNQRQNGSSDANEPSTEPSLTINGNPQAELDRLPQIQPSDTQLPSQSQ